MPNQNELMMHLLFFGTSTALILIHGFNRIFETSKDDTLGDALGNYIMAIKAIWQESINPKLSSYGDLKGHYYYPLAFPWICGQLAKTFLTQIKIKKRSSVKQLLNLLKEEDIDHLDKSLILMKCMSGLILPIIGQIISAYIVFELFGATTISIISVCALLSILDALFTDKTNMMSSRNAGFVYYLGFSWSIFMVMSQTNIGIIGVTIPPDLLLKIVFTICSLGLFQTSQRYFQCFVSTSIVFMYLKPEYSLELLILFIMSNFILLQIPKSDYGSAVKSHIYNRIHDAEWSNKLYGHFRYGFLNRLKSTMLKGFIEDAFKYKYLTNSMASPPYYKKNLLSGFLVHRVYIFNWILLISFKEYLDSNTHDIILLTIFSVIIPSILCFFKPFQDYGSSEVYIWSNLPLGLISLMWTMSKATGILTSELSWFQIGILLFILLDVCLIGASSIINKLRIAIKVKPIISQSALLDGFMTDFGMAKNVAEIVRFVQSTSTNISKSNCKVSSISIMCNEIHTQSFAEVLISYINRLKLENLIAKPGFTPIDNYYYGYFLDYVGFTIDTKLTLSKIKPDILILNSSVGYSNMLLQNFKRKRIKNIIFRTGDLYVISVSGLFQVENGRLVVRQTQ